MNAYAPPPPPVPVAMPKMLTARDIDRLFKRRPGWFDAARVRKKLYARGFPRPEMAGRWSPGAVRAWMERTAPAEVPADVRVRPRRRRTPAASGYAEP